MYLNKLIIFVFVILIISSCGGGNDTDDKVAPSIAIIGETPVFLKKGSVYIEKGAIAYDNTDGVLSIVHNGEVNTQKIGTYTVNYTVTDKAGNKGEVERIIHVVSRYINYFEKWNKYFGLEDQDEFFEKLTVTKNGIYAVGGISNKNRGLIKKIDNVDGTPLWSQSTSSEQANHFYSIASGSDNHLIVVGSTQKNQLGSTTDALILKLDSDGNVLWRKKFGGADNDLVIDVAIDHKDNAYVIVIRDKTDSDYFGDAFLLKYSSDGNLLNTIKLGSANASFNYNRYGIAIDSSNTVYVVGHFISSTIMKIDPNGVVLWTKVFPENVIDFKFINGLIVYDNFLYAVGGWQSVDNQYFSLYDYAFIMKLDTDGNTIFDKAYKYDNEFKSILHTNGSVFYDLVANKDGTITVVGSIVGGNGLFADEDGLVVTFDEHGNELYERIYGNRGDAPSDYFRSIVSNGNGNIFIVGKTFQNYSEYTVDIINTDAWILNLQIIP